MSKFNLILNKLNYLRSEEKKYKPGTGNFIVIDNKIDNIIFNTVPFKEVCLVGRGLNRDLTNKDCAKMIVATLNHKPLYEVFDLPISVSMPLALLEYQHQTGLSQSAFAERYGIKQSKLSRMEDCEEKVDPAFLDKVAKDLHKTFIIGAPVVIK